MERPSPVLTFTNWQGKTHLQIENEFGEMIERIRKKAEKETRKISSTVNRSPSK